MEFLETHQDFLKAHWVAGVGPEPDWKKGLPPPPSQKPYSEDATLIDLVAPQDLTVGKVPPIDVMKHRKSRRVLAVPRGKPGRVIPGSSPITSRLRWKL